MSTRAVCEALDIELIELPDWICCGASSGHSTDEILEVGLPAKNIQIAEGIGLDVAVPCAACYNRLKSAAHALRTQDEVQTQMKELLQYEFKGNVAVLNLVELMLEKIGLEALKDRVKKPLEGLKVACYYGCLLVRPQEITGFDDAEDPQSLDDILSVLGATPVKWSLKTECCGGSLSLTRDDICTSLVDEIIESAKEAGAEAIVTACPLCLENLEMRQSGGKFPIFYFTEFLGVAMGLEESHEWLGHHIVETETIREKIGVVYEK